MISHKNKGIHMVTFLLLIIGGLNWLLVGLFGWEIGSLFGGQNAMLSRIIYVLVGLAAVYELASHKNRCKECMEKGAGNMPHPPMTPPSSGASM